MSTVLRVKRRFDYEPVDTLVITGKKRKIETSGSDEVKFDVPLTEVVKFAGTVKSTEDDVIEHIRKTLTKDELKSNYKQHTVDITNKALEAAKEKSRENRYKVVNYFRSNAAASSKDDNESVMTVIEVAHSKLPNAEETSDLNNDEIGYVYDLYYAQTNEDLPLDVEYMIQPFQDDLVFDNYMENDTCPDDESSEDSNCESHFRNDYPDADDSQNFIDEDDIRAAMTRMKVGDDSSDLSSETDFAYSVVEDDVEKYGYKYAKYKARVAEELDEYYEESSHLYRELSSRDVEFDIDSD